MCGPLQVLVMGNWLISGRSWDFVLYHFGRIFTYSLLGILAAVFGMSLGIYEWQSSFTILAGLFLLLGYFGMRMLKWDKRLYALIVPFIQRLHPGGKKKNGSWYTISGALNGLLPCGMVYAALVPALSLENPFTGALYMSMFGLGTLPLMLAFSLLANRLNLQWMPRLQKIIPITIILIAGLLIVRGMQLDIPYLSPQLKPGTEQIEGCR